MNTSPLASLLAALTGACLALVVAPVASAQQVERGVAIGSESIASSVDGFSYSPDSSSELEFVGTSLAPRSGGAGTVRVARDKTEINGRFQRLAEPSSLGPFAVYVLWVVTPEGRAASVGVLAADADRARVEAVTPLSSFALIVTAEPHFAVSIPSKYIVMQNVGKAVKGTKLAVTALVSRADYTTLKPAKREPKSPVPLDLEMARYAVAIAESARAKELATAAYERAQHALESAEGALLSKKSGEHARVGEFAREAIQAGEDARAAAELRQAAADRATQAGLIREGELAVKEQEAKGTALRAELAAARDRALAAEEQLPNPAKRLALTAELLNRWFTLPPPSESGLTLHVAEESFAKSSTDLVPAMQERLALAIGVMLGIGNLNVSVTPSVLANSDIQKLALSQQRARAVMEWCASMGVKAVVGSAASDAETSLALGPGIDLTITAGGFDQSKSDVPKSGAGGP